MNTQITINRLSELKLEGMKRMYETLLKIPVQNHLSLNQFMAQLADAEMNSRTEKRTAIYLKQSKLRYVALIEQVHFKQERNLPKVQFLTLADCSFIDRAENLLITGLTGTGKSFIACALGHQACTLGYKTLYFGIHRFLEMIALAKLDGSYIKTLNRIENASLIIFDDFGLSPLDVNTRRA